jgi:hypothetical protein
MVEQVSGSGYEQLTYRYAMGFGTKSVGGEVVSFLLADQLGSFPLQR